MKPALTYTACKTHAAILIIECKCKSQQFLEMGHCQVVETVTRYLLVTVKSNYSYWQRYTSGK